MASEVDIVNTALSYLGDSATVTAISPPDGSAQAALASRFYPMARNELLEMHAWGFSTARASMALLANTPLSVWKYAYALPLSVVNVLAVLDPSAGSDYSVDLTGWGGVVGPINTNGGPIPATVGVGAYTPQDFVVETAPDGSDIVLTNQPNAVLRFTQIITDTSKFSPLFSSALSWLLASKLAGSILKGDSGTKTALALYNNFLVVFGQASTSDASQRRATSQVQTAWMAGR